MNHDTREVTTELGELRESPPQFLFAETALSPDSLRLENEQLTSRLAALTRQMEQEQAESQRRLDQEKEVIIHLLAQIEACEAEFVQSNQELTDQLRDKELQLSAASQRLSAYEKTQDDLLLELQNALTDYENAQGEIHKTNADAVALRQQLTTALEESAEAQAALTALMKRYETERQQAVTTLPDQAVGSLLPDRDQLSSEPEFTRLTPSERVDKSPGHQRVMPLPVSESFARPVVSPAPEVVRLSELIEELKRKLTPLLQGRNLRLSAEVEEQAEQIRTNRKLLRQTLSNLLSEAVISTQEGMVMITARRTGDTITIAVSDTGSGLHGEKRGATGPLRITQVESCETTSTYASARELVERLNGRLRVRSIPNFGTTASLLLPAEPDATAMTQSA